MKRIVSLALVAALVMTIAPFAMAQGGPAVTGAGGENRALGLQVYGSLDLQMRYGDSGYAVGVTDGGTDDPAWIGSPKMLLGLKANLADKASLVAELYVPRIGSLFLGPSNYFGGFGIDGSGGVDIGVRQAYVKIEDALVQDLAITFGLQDLVFDVVGQGNPLLIALGDAEYAGILADEAWQGTTYIESRPGGLRADYKLGAAGSLSAYHMVVGLNNLEDMEAITGVQGQYKVTEKTSVEGMINLMNLGFGVDGKKSEVWLLGIGAASNGEFVDGLNLWAQVGFNFGTVETIGADEVDAAGLMFDIGASYQLDMAMKPKFGVEYLYVSGDKDETGADDKYEGFISYEDNDDLIVLEDNEFGFDTDENYSVIKLRASITTDVAGPVKDNFTLELVLGIAKMVEEIGNEDGLGTEIDIKASWAASKNLTVYGGFGFLVGSDVLETQVSGFEEYDSAFTYFVGTNVTF
jgi:hypothetical protein